MPDGLLAITFVVAAGVSLAASSVLVSRLERVGARFGLTEGLLGMVAALAADAPEITTAVTALIGHRARIGAGVIIGSNVFNLAALLGFAAVVAGRIALHRRVIALEGAVALPIASVCLVVVVGALPPAVGLALVSAVLVPYLVVLGLPGERLGRLGMPPAWARWLAGAVAEEELELEPAIHPPRGRLSDVVAAAAAVLVVVAASVAMEQTASTLGTREAVPEIVIGALVLAGVTSLPNAVAAIYLARRGRGTATLSTAMNSNALNVAAGLLLPATIVGLGPASGSGTLVAAWYLGLTAFALGLAYHGRGLARGPGLLILCAYASFVGVLLATAYPSRSGVLVSIAVPAALGLALASGPRLVRSGDSLVEGWSIGRVWILALALSSLIAAVDAILGHHIILIGLLVVGPCCALLTGRWAETASAGAWAVALAVLVGIPDGIWGTSTHLILLAAVVIVSLVSTSSAAIVQRRR